MTRRVEAWLGRWQPRFSADDGAERDGSGGSGMKQRGAVKAAWSVWFAVLDGKEMLERGHHA